MTHRKAPGDPSRRQLLLGTATLTSLFARTGAAQSGSKVKLGYDNFALRSFGWKAAALIEYAALQRLDSLFITDLDAFESRDSAHLRELRALAQDKGVQIHLGTWSVCPSSTTFKKNWGTADEHLALGIRMAKDLGSPVLRVILGNHEDRLTPGGIKARISDMVKVLKRNRRRIADAGIKIAVENHAGDMRSHELVSLVEQAGPDHVGVNIDPGNAVWALEDPLDHLEGLARYTVTSSMRDSRAWVSAHGVTVQWTAMGDGMVDFGAYIKRFAQLCPNVPVHIETISGFNREFRLFDPGFWRAFERLPAADLARFWRFASSGKPAAAWQRPQQQDQVTADRSFQKEQLERSLKYCKQTLGLGLQA